MHSNKLNVMLGLFTTIWVVNVLIFTLVFLAGYHVISFSAIVLTVFIGAMNAVNAVCFFLCGRILKSMLETERVN